MGLIILSGLSESFIQDNINNYYVTSQPDVIFISFNEFLKTGRNCPRACTGQQQINNFANSRSTFILDTFKIFMKIIERDGESIFCLISNDEKDNSHYAQKD